ncbi:F-box/SPRY domain-containing protein 1 isoform X2 [Copidosoma floridanum]|nr:F-box/SPRY domain-containing protein 1 isoform X2 [Copidosoma floridanum]
MQHKPRRRPNIVNAAGQPRKNKTSSSITNNSVSQPHATTTTTTSSSITTTTAATTSTAATVAEMRCLGGLASSSGLSKNSDNNTGNISSLPDHILEIIMSHLDLYTLGNCHLVCERWYRLLSCYENNEIWRVQCKKKLHDEILSSELLSSLPSFKAKLRAHYYAWNPNDCSRNIFTKFNDFMLHRNPVAQSTDACRGKIGFRHGRHAWEIIWEGPLGTVAVIGIATKNASLVCQGYVALLGSDEHSWGWNLVDNNLLHNGDTQGNYPFLNNAPKYQVGERIRVILDCDNNTLSFEKNYEFLGVAFRGLPDKRLYPAVSAVYGNTEVSMVYLGPPLDG